MTLNTLKSICAAYLGQATSALTVGGVDLFLVAANNARRTAEQLHDFEDCRITASLSIDGVTGGSLSSATISENVGLTDAMDVSGDVYSRSGNFSGYPMYTLADVTTTFLYFNPGNNRYIISDTLSTNSQTSGFQPASAGTTIIGVYIGFGTSFGSPDLVVTVSSGPPAFSGVKTITDVQRTNADLTLQPLDFTSSHTAIERVRDEINVSGDYFFDSRYPSDRQLYSLGQDGTLIQRNNSIYIFPRPAVATAPLVVSLEGYGWLRDYVASDLLLLDPVDFFVQYGPSYLQWSIILELNYLFKVFVPRVEGELTPPQQMKEEAWRDLLVWDSWRVDSNSTSTR